MSSKYKLKTTSHFWGDRYDWFLGRFQKRGYRWTKRVRK